VSIGGGQISFELGAIYIPRALAFPRSNQFRFVFAEPTQRAHRDMARRIRFGDGELNGCVVTRGDGGREFVNTIRERLHRVGRWRPPTQNTEFGFPSFDQHQRGIRCDEPR
jgi:hypothetical protein